jgi:hypothetical protein
MAVPPIKGTEIKVRPGAERQKNRVFSRQVPKILTRFPKMTAAMICNAGSTLIEGLPHPSGRESQFPLFTVMAPSRFKITVIIFTIITRTSQVSINNRNDVNLFTYLLT